MLLPFFLLDPLIATIIFIRFPHFTHLCVDPLSLKIEIIILLLARFCNTLREDRDLFIQLLVIVHCFLAFVFSLVAGYNTSHTHLLSMHKEVYLCLGLRFLGTV